MIYNQAVGALYADDGTFLKTVHCPLALHPDQLYSASGADRFCSACDKSIKCIDDMTDDDLAMAVAKDDSLCVFATAEAKNIVFLQPWGNVAINYPGWPTIQTLRGLEAMSAAQENGFALLIKVAGSPNDFGDRKFIVYQNSKTGKLWWSGDYRNPSPRPADEGCKEIDGDWRLVCDWFYVRADRPFPLAAYAIPKDIVVGAKYFLPDVIDEIGLELWNQGNAHRMVSVVAKWNGCDFDVEKPVKASWVG